MAATRLKIVGTGSCLPLRLIHDFQKPLFCLTTEQFSTLLQSILNQLWPTEGGSAPGSCSHMVSSLHGGALTCIRGWHDELCSQTMISEVFLSPCSDRIIPVVNAVKPEGLSRTCIQFWLSKVCLAHRHVSRFSEFFYNIIYCKYFQIQYNFTWRNMIWKNAKI